LINQIIIVDFLFIVTVLDAVIFNAKESVFLARCEEFALTAAYTRWGKYFVFLQLHS